MFNISNLSDISKISIIFKISKVSENPVNPLAALIFPTEARKYQNNFYFVLYPDGIEPNCVM